MTTRHLPAVVLVAVAVGQIGLARTGGLTPWKGGGFGMFASLDHGAYRRMDVVVDGADRSEAIEIPPSLEVAAARATAYPSTWLLTQLAEGVAAREQRYLRSVSRVTITVWQTGFASETLRPSERPFRTFTYDVPAEPRLVR